MKVTFITLTSRITREIPISLTNHFINLEPELPDGKDIYEKEFLEFFKIERAKLKEITPFVFRAVDVDETGVIYYDTRLGYHKILELKRETKNE